MYVYIYIYLSLFVCPESTKKHNIAIAYSGQDSETTMKSGAGTNLKWGDHTCGSKHRKIFDYFPLHFFWLCKYISRVGERLRAAQYSLVGFLFAFLLLTVPPPLPVRYGGGAGGTEHCPKSVCQ